MKYEFNKGYDFDGPFNSLHDTMLTFDGRAFTMIFPFISESRHFSIDEQLQWNY